MKRVFFSLGFAMLAAGCSSSDGPSVIEKARSAAEAAKDKAISYAQDPQAAAKAAVGRQNESTAAKEEAYQGIMEQESQ